MFVLVGDYGEVVGVYDSAGEPERIAEKLNHLLEGNRSVRYTIGGRKYINENGENGMYVAEVKLNPKLEDFRIERREGRESQ